MDIASQKVRLRAKMKALRTTLKAENLDAANLLSENLPDSLLRSPAKVVSGYVPIGSEIDPILLAHELTRKGRKLCLPRLVLGADELSFFIWDFGDPLESGPFSLVQPDGNPERVYPDLLLVPLLAFDRKGSRLGYGKGHFDRAIESLRKLSKITLCGIGFSGQEVSRVPTERHDQKLDWVITEREAIRIE